MTGICPIFPLRADGAGVHGPGGAEERWLAAGGDAEALVAAPVTPVTEELIARMPHLKLIHSDGVGYDRIDLAAAREGASMCATAPGATQAPWRSWR